MREETLSYAHIGLPRPQRGLWVGVYRRYVMGDDSWGILPESDLREALQWDDSEKDINTLRVTAIKEELAATGEILRDQFMKIGGLIALLGFIIAIGLSRNVDGDKLALRVVSLAAVYAIWAQMPRWKVIRRFRKRPDAGIRTGSLKTEWDVFYYTYCWLVRRENTTNAIETLVIGTSLLTIAALCFVFFTA